MFPLRNSSTATLRKLLVDIILVLGILQLVQSFLLTDAGGRWVSLGAAIALLALGWLFMRPVDNFRRITTTAGHDIHEVGIAIRDLRAAYLGE